MAEAPSEGYVLGCLLILEQAFFGFVLVFPPFQAATVEGSNFRSSFLIWSMRWDPRQIETGPLYYRLIHPRRKKRAPAGLPQGG